MTTGQTNPNSSKSKGLICLEYILLFTFACIMAIRTTITESPNAQSSGQPIDFGNSIYSLWLSAVLLVSFTLWIVYNLCSKRFSYRFTTMEIGLGLFMIAAIAAGLAASNKRIAITSSIMLVAPVLTSILLVQILDSHSKIKMLLVVIAALGIVSAYQCNEQFLSANEIRIEQYEKDPDSMLEALGIQPGTLNHMMLEHRLYSKDVNGFFTTGNSAGSFALLASFTGFSLFIQRFKNRKSDPNAIVWVITSGIAAAVIIYGLIITRSKGAITASLLAAVILAVYFFFGDWLKVHKKAILAVFLLAAVVGTSTIVIYGLNHGRLPGGNSMLVRWQYWKGAAKIIADHPITGVGAGNFGRFYHHYKPAAAPETVADPHNFPLSILTQYGPIGLVGFLAIFLMPLWRSFPSSCTICRPKICLPSPGDKITASILLIFATAALLLVRPIVSPISPSAPSEERLAAIFLLYLMPVVVFIIGFLILIPSGKSVQKDNTNTTIAVLSCSCVGLLLHNLIDFAIFEPGVFISLCAIMACLIASNLNQNGQYQLHLYPSLPKRIIALAALIVVVGIFFYCGLIPVARTSKKLKQVGEIMEGRSFADPHELLKEAGKIDPLDPEILHLNGKLYLQHYDVTGKTEPVLLEKAADCFMGAIDRDRADYKNYESLSGAYYQLAQASVGQARSDWLKKAFKYALQARQLYPGSERLRFELAEITELSGKPDIAIEYYKEAIDIEDKYQEQFRMMYPGRKMVSRLGEEKYGFAKKRLKELTKP